MMPSAVRVLRSLATMIVGYLIFALSAFALFHFAGRAPHAPQPAWFMVVSAIYGMLFAALGATVSLVTSPGAGATWSQSSAILLTAPCAWLGGRLGGE